MAQSSILDRMKALTGESDLLIFYVELLQAADSCEVPLFRILAPQFVCPKDDNTPVDKLDNIVITLQTPAEASFAVAWSVRWTPLPAPTQRFTIMLWRAARTLELKLNKPPTEPFVYVIENDELLHGVDYIFNVSVVEKDGTLSTPKSFHIDNTYGDQKLDMIEGRGDLLSIVLIGGVQTYADVVFTLDAQVTTCFATQDYYFVWTIKSTGGALQVDVSAIRGRLLHIPPNTLIAGRVYDVNCEVVKESTGLRIAQTGLTFQVLHRSIEVYLNVDYLIVPINKAFSIDSSVFNHDNAKEALTYTWECKFGGEPFDVEIASNESLRFPSGLPKLGLYEIKLSVTVLTQSASAVAVVQTVKLALPVIQIAQSPGILNEGSTIHLEANVSDVTPTCSLTWYFATEESLNLDNEVNGTKMQHGEPLSDSIEIFSLEENFLDELADFTNETEWRQVSAIMAAASGRARFVAKCGCSMTFECSAEGLVYADTRFKMNKSPKPGEVYISPDTGTALETIFRLSTLAVMDPDFPLRYTFHCQVGDNETLLLGSFTDYLAVETFLPYVEGGTEIWVEVCDALGACGTGVHSAIQLSPGDGSTMETFLDDVKGHLKRCEMMYFRIDAMSAVITYVHTNQAEVLKKFASSLVEILSTITEDCVNSSNSDYLALLSWLAGQGVDTSSLMQ